MSSGEAEYNALAYGMQQVLNIWQLILELNGLDCDTPLSIPVYCDSTSAIGIGSSLEDTNRARHIQRGYQYIRDGIESRNYVLYKIDSDLNPSDIGTKHVEKETRKDHMTVLHVKTDEWCKRCLKRSVEIEAIGVIYAKPLRVVATK